jgi:cytochrome c5
MRSFRMNAVALCLAGVPLIAAPRFALAQDAGAKAFAETCSACHSAKIRPLDQKRMSKDEWKKAIDKMVDMGAEIPKDKAAQIVDYLARTQGPESK